MAILRAEGSKNGVAPAHPSIFAPPHFLPPSAPSPCFLAAWAVSRSRPRQNSPLNTHSRDRSGGLVVFRSEIRLLLYQNRLEIDPS